MRGERYRTISSTICTILSYLHKTTPAIKKILLGASVECVGIGLAFDTLGLLCIKFRGSTVLLTGDDTITI